MRGKFGTEKFGRKRLGVIIQPNESGVTSGNEKKIPECGGFSVKNVSFCVGKRSK
jgi:hypothetical protein